MRRFTLCSLFIFLPVLVISGNYEFDFDRTAARITGSDAHGLTIELEVPDFGFTPESLNGNEYSRLKIPGWGVTGEFGRPELPVISKTIALPYDAKIEYSFEIIESETITGIDIAPLQHYKSDNPAVADADFILDDQFYIDDKFYPESRIIVSDPVIMRDLRMARVTVNPFRYNAARRELEVVKRMRVNIGFIDDANPVNPKISRRGKVSSSFLPLYRSMAENYDDLELDEVTVRGGYLFITPNTSVNPYLAPLIDWKKEKGFPVTVVTTQETGTSVTAIRTYIANAYYTWETPPDFVVLVGDMNGSLTIATDYYYCGPGDNSVTDHVYAKIEGTDYFPDVMLGRLSVANNTDLSTVVSKILHYETMDLPWNDWIMRSEMIADYANISCQLTKEFGKEICLDNGFTTVYEDYFSWTAPTANIANHINNGVGIVNFRGYLGWGGWEQAEINSLGNGGKLPVVNGCTCETGSFELGECISEAWLRAGTSGNPIGGMGCVGPSSWNTHTKWNNCLDSGFMFGFLNLDLEYWMESVINGKLELWTSYPYNHGSGYPSNSVECYYYIYNLIGDPGLSVRMAIPYQLTAETPGDVPLGSNYYPVTVTNASGDPVEGAYVNLWKGEEVFAGGYTDENGYIILPIAPQTAGAMKVCATLQNTIPARETVQIVAGELFLGISDQIIDDDNVPPSSGNGDGIVNPGEVIALSLQVENFGMENTASITADISCENPEILILTPSVTFGDVNAGSAVWGSEPFEIIFSSSCYNGEYIEMDVVFTDNLAREWSSMLFFDIQTADLAVTSFDLPSAGTNGLLDPGETSTMTLDLRNLGNYNSEILSAILTCESDAVEILDAAGEFSPINAGMTGSNTGNTFELHTPVETFPGTPVTLDLALSSPSGFHQDIGFDMILGIPDSTDPLVADAYGYYCYDDMDAGYLAAPEYQWFEINTLTTYLNLPDYGDEDDCSIVVHFPPGFSFRYYGQDFDRITVCSNGWAALGETEMCNFRNYPITGAQVAPACLAPFWDDLYLQSGGGQNGKVYAYYDSPNDRYIIEWYNVRKANINLYDQRFQIVLYDPLVYPTPTGDGVIDFLYNNISNNGEEHNATVGIATPWNGDGVAYTYANQYPPGAVVLHDGLALRFTTQANEGWEPPEISVTPTQLNFEIPALSYGSETLNIANSGFSSLVYNITYEITGGANITLPGGGMTDDLGGPDNWGYTFIDNNEPQGPNYNWIDISAVGTPVVFPHNDSTIIGLPIGFDFPFYDNVYSEYNLSANGWLSFSFTGNIWANTSLPNPAAPLDMIAPLWDDLDPLVPGAEVLYWNNGADSLVVSFIDVDHWGTTYNATYTFQVILTADGNITTQYLDISGSDQDLYTIGIQNSDGTDGLEAAFDVIYIQDQMAVDFYYPRLRVIPASGSVPQGGSEDVIVTAYSYGMESGGFEATLHIDNNDPSQPLIDVPLTITIGAGPPVPFTLSLEPQGAPIVIPATGGGFEYDLNLTNISGLTQLFDLWIMVDLPGGSTYGPILLRQNVNIGPGVNLSRVLNQNIPGGAPSGDYYYFCDVGVYPDSVTVTDGFPFEKLGVDLSGVTGWDLYGWDEETELTPGKFVFHGAVPNPFNPVTDISFEIPEMSKVEIIVFDVLGRKTATLQNGYLAPGFHSLQWNASNFSSGVYFIQIRAGDHTAVSKIMLLK